MKTMQTRATVETLIAKIQNAEEARKQANRLGHTKASSVLHAHASMLAVDHDDAMHLYFAGLRQRMLDTYFPR